MTGYCTIQFGKFVANERVNRLCLFGCGRLAGADCPNRFISHDGAGKGFDPDPLQNGIQLLSDS